MIAPRGNSPSTDEVPQDPAVRPPPQSASRGDISYFTQEMANVNSSIVEIRLQLSQNQSELKQEIKAAVDSFLKVSLELKADAKVLGSEVRAEVKVADASIKSLTTSVNDLKPKVDTLTRWGWSVIGGVAAMLVVIPATLAYGQKIVNFFSPSSPAVQPSSQPQKPP